ncbi:MAG: ammonia-forming cytochrome c nitrite reductase subunit c552 [FCB group bacterium]|nr:ammonia-forming cytochrome c nitrite reductase subunit c552 [FCB group bacterium]
MSDSTKSCLRLILIPLFLIPVQLAAQSALNCSQCHSTENSHWLLSHHANTQDDVAGELAEEWAGLPPDSVISGQDAEDCIACHGATAIIANGGMTETEALGYFFSTTGGLFTSATQAQHADEWPDNACVTCHDVPTDHPSSMPTLAIFNSPTAQYAAVSDVASLCGQCHGTLRYPNNDHQRMDAWLLSKHGQGGQDDIAGEIAEEWAGASPEDVIAEEDCIACHASTTVLLNGGISEADALDLMVTTENGVFTENSVPQNTALWPEVTCTACHNQHNPDAISYFNSGTGEYEVLTTSQELCGKCHGTLRFPDTDHLSYDIALGTEGIGVSDLQTMPGIQCVDCHMHIGDVEDTNASVYGGHRWTVFMSEDDGTESASCTGCHTTMDVASARSTIQDWQTEYANLDSVASVRVADAVSFLTGSTDTTKLQMLEEAQYNLALAEGDESGGVHNHDYTVSLLNDAIQKATDIVLGVNDEPNPLPAEYALYQNYPNPFNPVTRIAYQIPNRGRVVLKVINMLGEEIAILVDENQAAGYHTVQFDSRDLPSGIYLYRIQAGDFHNVKSMLLLK